MWGYAEGNATVVGIVVVIVGAAAIGYGVEAGDVAELARGSIADRPWGRTFATLGLRGVTGQLTVAADGRRYLVVFDQGAVVAAWSPMASDAAVRVALT